MSSVLVEQRSKFDPYKNPEKGFRTLDSLDQIDFRSLHSSRITTFNEQNKKMLDHHIECGAHGNLIY